MKIKREIFWKNPKYKPYPKLTKDIECDYLIVGGGITGVSLAYFLSSLSKNKVVLVEKNFIGSGATSSSAGMLTLRGELDLSQIFEILGKKKGFEYWNANKHGLEIVRNIIHKEKMDCDYEPNNTIFGNIKGDSTHTYLSKEYLLEKELDSKAKFLIGDEIKKELNTSLFDQAVLSYDHGISVNPVKHVQELARVSSSKGVKIFEKTKLESYNKKYAVASNNKIFYKKMILAIDKDLLNKGVKNRKSTIMITKPLSDSDLKKINMGKKFIWDTQEEYHYLKLTKENRLMIGFGDLFVDKKNKKLSLHTHHLHQIISFVKKLFPQIKITPEYAWSGIFSTSYNLLPMLREKENLISISGCGSQVVCVLASHHLAHKLLGGKSPLDKILKSEKAVK